MKSIQRLTGAILLTAGWAVTSTASAVSMDDIEFWLGEGSNQSAFVIDWNDGKPAYMWGYRWDDPATGQDMVTSIDMLDPRLGVVFGPPDQDFGAFVEEFSFDFDLSGTYESDEDRAPRSDPDFLEEKFWSLFHSSEGNDNPYAGGAWGSAFVGLSGLTLENGMWVGFGYGEWPVDDPSVPLAVAVPEPSVLLLGLLAGVMMLFRRRRI